MKQITTEATVQNIQTIIAFVEGELEGAGCPLREQTQILMAVDEVMANISGYAYTPGTGNVTVTFEQEKQAGTVALTFIDEGIPFDPLQIPEPDVTLPAEKRQVGGLGIFLVRKTMDEVTYRREHGRNILCIRKKI